jgi:hypothetical protein
MRCSSRGLQEHMRCSSRGLQIDHRVPGIGTPKICVMRVRHMWTKGSFKQEFWEMMMGIHATEEDVDQVNHLWTSRPRWIGRVCTLPSGSAALGFRGFGVSSPLLWARWNTADVLGSVGVEELYFTMVEHPEWVTYTVWLSWNGYNLQVADLMTKVSMGARMHRLIVQGDRVISTMTGLCHKDIWDDIMKGAMGWRHEDVMRWCHMSITKAYWL